MQPGCLFTQCSRDLSLIQIKLPEAEAFFTVELSCIIKQANLHLKMSSTQKVKPAPLLMMDNRKWKSSNSLNECKQFKSPCWQSNYTCADGSGLASSSVLYLEREERKGWCHQRFIFFKYIYSTIWRKTNFSIVVVFLVVAYPHSDAVKHLLAATTGPAPRTL